MWSLRREAHRGVKSQMTARTLLWTSSLFLLTPMIGVAQQPQLAEQPALGQSSNPQEEKDKVANPQNPANEQDLARTEDQVETQPPHDAPPFVRMDTGQVVEHAVSSIHLGGLSLFSASASFLYDDLTTTNTTQILRTGIVSGTIIYSVKHGSSGLDFQYLPQVVFSNEGTASNLGNQSTLLHTFLRLSRHWSLDLSDSFTYQPNSGFVPQASIVPVFPTGGIQQNPFLAANQHYLTNLVQVTANVDLNARNRLTFSGRYEYLHVSSFVPPLNAPPVNASLTATGDDNLGGAGMGWVHNWNPTDTFSVNGNYDRRYLGIGGATNYYLVTIGFRKRLLPGFFVSASGGPSYQTQDVPASTGNNHTNNTTYEASFALTKSFRRSGLALSFDRDHTATQYLAGTLTDRYGISYSLGLGRRWSTGVGIGYMRQEFSLNGATQRPYNGRTGWANLSFQMAREWLLYANYLRFTDTGLFTFAPVVRNIGTVGIRWSWQPKQRAAEAGRTGVF